MAMFSNFNVLQFELFVFKFLWFMLDVFIHCLGVKNE